MWKLKKKFTAVGTRTHDHAHDRRSPYQLNHCGWLTIVQQFVQKIKLKNWQLSRFWKDRKMWLSWQSVKNCVKSYKFDKLRIFTKGRVDSCLKLKNNGNKRFIDLSTPIIFYPAVSDYCRGRIDCFLDHTWINIEKLRQWIAIYRPVNTEYFLPYFFWRHKVPFHFLEMFFWFFCREVSLGVIKNLVENTKRIPPLENYRIIAIRNVCVRLIEGWRIACFTILGFCKERSWRHEIRKTRKLLGR